MATMTIRTTVAFDPATVARWERLTRRWGVSKSEALRRALEAAEAPLLNREVKTVGPSAAIPGQEEIAQMTTAEALAWLRANSLVTAEAGREWREQLRQTREDIAARP
jgi:hypothetical protein